MLEVNKQDPGRAAAALRMMIMKDLAKMVHLPLIRQVLKIKMKKKNSSWATAQLSRLKGLRCKVFWLTPPVATLEGHIQARQHPQVT